DRGTHRAPGGAEVASKRLAKQDPGTNPPDSRAAVRKGSRPARPTEPGGSGDLAYRARIWVQCLEAGSQPADRKEQAEDTEAIDMASSATATPQSAAGTGPSEQQQLFAR